VLWARLRHHPLEIAAELIAARGGTSGLDEKRGRKN